MHGPGETPRDEDSGAAPEAPAEAAAGAHNAADAAQAPPGEPETGRPGGGLRVLAAAVMLPWLLGYGVIGTWTVVRGARAAASGLKTFDAGYTRLVSPGGVILVGALLLAGFAVLLAVSCCSCSEAAAAPRGRRSAVVAVLLVAGSVWAATRGGLSPGLWVFFFFGLVYAAVVAVIMLIGVTRARGRGRIAPP